MIHSGGNADDCSTSLLSGELLPKDSLWLETGGVLDELNAHLGLLTATDSGCDEALSRELTRIQSELFQLGTLIATTPGSDARKRLTPLLPEHSIWIDTAAQRMRDALPACASFVLPGGCMAAAQAHVARTVCRRAERRVVHLAREERDPELAVVQTWLNRLANYLFVCARWCNHQAGTAERGMHSSE